MLCLLHWVLLVSAWLVVSGDGVKRVRLNRKTPAHLARQGFSGVPVRPRVWKRLRCSLDSDASLPGAKFLRVHPEVGGHGSGFVRAGIGWGRGLHEPTSPGSCMRGSN